ncbi:MAG TPA: hypothetical protein H9743_00480 [Candidatus Mediterraneibacter vanvlietii]|nr:hypothetical protein [Candidatus Mediterraneibacter vanvlietii]
MSNCKHVFMGTEEGVECQKCHKKMTVEEYMELRYGKKKGAAKNERVSKDADVSENPAE